METALLLPLVALVLAAVVQVGLVTRDQVHLTHATSAAARAVMVEPSRAAAVRSLDESGLRLSGRTLDVSGDLTRGSLVTVTVSARPTKVPLVGLAVAGVRLRERLVVRIE